MVKVLVAGDVLGRIDLLYSRIKKLQSKGQNFSCVFCVGAFFPNDNSDCPDWNKYKTGEETIPLQTYILGPSTVSESRFYAGLDNGGDLCELITCLGRCGLYKTLDGLRIGYLSGSSNKNDQNYAVQENANLKFKSLINPNDSTVDIFISSSWPMGISNLGNSPDDPALLEAGNIDVARSSRELKPRYHFAGSECKHYERRPYKNHTQLPKITRFIALANVGNKNKEKYLYAFNINPDESISKVPDDVTQCPFPEEKNEKVKKEQGNYRWALPNGPEIQDDMDDPDFVERKRRQQQIRSDIREGKRQKREEGDCWFCLGGEHVRKHMVVSVGHHCYVALARGGVNSQHILILPIQHHQRNGSYCKKIFRTQSAFKTKFETFLDIQKLIYQKFVNNTR